MKFQHLVQLNMVIQLQFVQKKVIYIKFHQNMVKYYNNGNLFIKMKSYLFDMMKIIKCYILFQQRNFKYLPLTQLNACQCKFYKNKWPIRQLTVNIKVDQLLVMRFYINLKFGILLQNNAMVTSMIFCDCLPLLTIETNKADIFIFQLVQKNDKL
ncbi:unnamed protein product [Paramecium sonneborni]|uniref:Uncharacterized protein n=1 Tax=Paramecium sonneborni TaxID=65129 RepID=A0A8S1QZE3_9CILI|nr:unnamed protein product [Paramecium sonneborni]